LVTAGILLLFKFSSFLLTKWGSIFLFYGGLLTLRLARFLALYEEDLKKVVALRTLSQIGLSVFTFGLGFPFLAFSHLVSHGFFKSLLFLQIGILIHSICSQQDPREYSLTHKRGFLLQAQVKVRLFSLCGLFYTNGLVTKDALLEFTASSSLGRLVFFFFILRIVITFFYSYRI
jgi:NADH-ubiquinone oxidoreductase chain 5